MLIRVNIRPMPKLILFPLLLIQVGFAQTLTHQEKNQTVHTIADLLNKKYVLIDSGKLMSKKILINLTNGDYDSISGHEAFANQLNADIRSVYHDLHMGIYFKDSIKGKKRAFLNDVKNSTRFEWEVLENNIGYIDINTFLFHDPKGKRIVNRALEDLSNVDAMVLDVRDNYGGNGNMASYLVGQFLPPKTQISSVYKRKGSQMKRVKRYFSKGKIQHLQTATVPIYVLINDQTASAGESLAYDLQAFNRATIIGQTSAGAAHANIEKSINKSFMMLLPHEKSFNSKTQSDYESTGVVPNVSTDSEQALEVALEMIK